MPIQENALIHPSVDVDPSNHIGPNVVIEEGVTLGRRNRILANAYLCSGTTLGDDNQIHMSAVIGHVPQDLTFEGEPSYTRIGNRNILREFVTVHRGTKPGTSTVIGDDCFFMATSHAAHNCQVANGVTLVNGVCLGGYVEVEDGAYLSAGTVYHQFIRIGKLVMVGGVGAANQDIPPYMMSWGRPVRVYGVNNVGLRHAGFGPEVRRRIQDAHAVLYRSGHTVPEALEILRADESAEIRHLVRFIENSKRGLVSGSGVIDEITKDLQHRKASHPQRS